LTTSNGLGRVEGFFHTELKMTLNPSQNSIQF